MGYPGVSLVQKSVRARRVAIVLIIVMVIVVATPLGVTSAQVSRDNTAESRAAQATNLDRRYRVSFRLRPGEGWNGERSWSWAREALPPEESLTQSLAGRLYGMEVEMEILPSETLEFDTD